MQGIIKYIQLNTKRCHIELVEVKMIESCVQIGTDLKVSEQYKCFTNCNVHANHVVQFSLLDQSCPALCSPMDCSPPGFPVLHLASGVC